MDTAAGGSCKSWCSSRCAWQMLRLRASTRHTRWRRWFDPKVGATVPLAQNEFPRNWQPPTLVEKSPRPERHHTEFHVAELCCFAAIVVTTGGLVPDAALSFSPRGGTQNGSKETVWRPSSKGFWCTHRLVSRHLTLRSRPLVLTGQAISSSSLPRAPTVACSS